MLAAYDACSEPKPSDIRNWYGEEKNKHNNWPGLPAGLYKDTGWSGWPDLVGKK